MPEASATSLDAWRPAAAPLDVVEPAVGAASAAASSSSSTVPSGSAPVQNPARLVSSERITLPSASMKLRPSDIASPTDFIVVVSVGSAPGNFSNANRGALTTT